MKLTDLYYSRVVLDSSVIAKPFLKEPDFSKVKEIFKMHVSKKSTILVSALLLFELGNIFTFKLNGKAAITALEGVRELGLSAIDLTLGEQRQALAIAHKYPAVSFYDASYHVLAKAFDAKFITADERYYEQVKGEGDVVLLKDLR